MRILAAADLHGYAGVYHWLVEQARAHEVGALILAGDLLGSLDEYEGVEEDMEASGREIVKILASSHRPVYFILGNDDLLDLPVKGTFIQGIHGRRVELGEVNLVGYACGPPCRRGLLERERAEMDRELEELRDLIDERTVFITHYPAAGTLDGQGSGGLLSLKVFLRKQPFLAHIHGHIHQDFGREGEHFNVASAARKRAMIIELPSTRHVVISES